MGRFNREPFKTSLVCWGRVITTKNSYNFSGKKNENHYFHALSLSKGNMFPDSPLQETKITIPDWIQMDINSSRTSTPAQYLEIRLTSFESWMQHSPFCIKNNKSHRGPALKKQPTLIRQCKKLWSSYLMNVLMALTVISFKCHLFSYLLQ